jgi:mannose-6-phosphate isomerase
MFRLTGALQRYDWGSTTAIQQFANLGVVGEPLAEIWYGAHPSAPSTTGEGHPLDRVIAAEPARILGPDVAARFDDRLPYLVKLIAPGRAVSAQVHPSAARAAEGFRSERDLDAGPRRFVDPSHKPELIYALTPFDGLVGLRPVDEMIRVLEPFRLQLTDRAADAAQQPDGAREAVRVLAQASGSEVEALVQRALALAEGVPDSAVRTVLELYGQYPGDAGVAVSLVLQRVLLQPGASVLVPSGVPHAYMSGLAIEVMANSDNVFRLGLTSKKVDLEESLVNLITDPAVVQRPHVADGDAGPAEFRLEIPSLATDAELTIDGDGPKVVLVATGRCTVTGRDRSLDLRPGQAAFLAHAEPVALAGAGTVAVISVPPVPADRRTVAAR